MSNYNAYPKETVDLVEIEVTYSGARIPLAELFFGITTSKDRSGVVFAPADEVDGKVGVLLDGTLPAGRYYVWAKHVKAGAEIQPWIDCGFFTLY